MSLEQQINSLPKFFLAVILIAVGILLMFLWQPPHSICDTQRETFEESLKGILLPQKIKKTTLPPRINALKEACEQGNSSGACYEYFGVLKNIAGSIKNASSECYADMYEISVVRKTIEGGIELMALMAWGTQPPGPNGNRNGWFQEYELAVFCHLKDAFVQSHGGIEDAWHEMRRQVNKKFPAAKGNSSALLNPEASVPKAVDSMSDNDIWAQSLFSIRCENYR